MTRKYRIVEIINGVGDRVYNIQYKQLWYWVNASIKRSMDVYSYGPWDFHSYKDAEDFIKKHYTYKTKIYHEVDL